MTAPRHRWRHRHAHRHRHRLHRWHRDRTGPWWLLGRVRVRLFIGLGLVLGAGLWLGQRLERDAHRWQLGLAFVGLWVLAGGLAWRSVRPLMITVQAARAIGAGKLDTRVDVGHHRGELRVLADALNFMAARIEAQLRDQRQLLAAVSHELRTPLGHLRVVIETAREQGDLTQLAQVERELRTLDDLVARLLASARLEFGSVERRPLEVGALVADVALAAGVDPEQVSADGDTTAAVDATLLRRAVANLIDNAATHGGGVAAITVTGDGVQVEIVVEDGGPGLPPELATDGVRAFVPSTGGGLGLGLALVARIAAAHDGKVTAATRPGGGARVGLAISVRPA
ncbi:MAG: ATP-binding protein [Kofleriaceae bacterium]